MERYLVFKGFHYYPSGGWSDFSKSFASIDKAKDYLIQHDKFDWCEIVDQTTGKIVFKTGR